MLKWTLSFLLVAIISGILGFGGLSAAAATIAKAIFFIALIMLAANLIKSAFRSSNG